MELLLYMSLLINNLTRTIPQINKLQVSHIFTVTAQVYLVQVWPCLSPGETLRNWCSIIREFNDGK